MSATTVRLIDCALLMSPPEQWSNADGFPYRQPCQLYVLRGDMWEPIREYPRADAAIRDVECMSDTICLLRVVRRNADGSEWCRFMARSGVYPP